MLEDKRLKKVILVFCLLSLLLAGVLLGSSEVIGFGGAGGCGGECKDCHILKPEEAAKILKEGGIPELRTVRVRGVSLAPAKGLWEIAIEKEGKSGILYLDFSKRFMVVGQIVELKTSKNITQERFLDLNRVDVSKIPVEDSLVMGNKSAKYRVFIFTDPECPFCGKLHKELKVVLEKRKDIVFYIKFFPLPNFKDSYWKSKSIQCSKSLKALEDNFEGKPPEKPSCETDVIDKNIQLGREIGVTSAPTIILPDGRLIAGAIPAHQLIELITGSKK